MNFDKMSDYVEASNTADLGADFQDNIAKEVARLKAQQ
mgnify:CR=1 FL=1